MKKHLSLIVFCLFLQTISHQAISDDYKAMKAAVAPVVNGLEDDVCWSTVPWSALDQVWVPAGGTAGTPEDFTGHYKAVWTADKLYILLKVTDDTVINWHPNDPLNNYWNNDCPELFIDENHSGGNHQCNNNAFACNISTLFDVIDVDTTCNAQLFKDILVGQRTRSGNTYLWEFAVNVYTDKYKLNAPNNPKADLYAGKVMGFSIAYNDSDENQVRERMYGSQVIKLSDPNVSYINADYFGTMELEDDVTATDQSFVSDGISLFPNPAEDKVSIDFGGKAVTQLELFDFSGKSVLTKTVSGNTQCTMDLSGFIPGAYYLRLSGNNFTVTEKLMAK